MKRRDLYQRMQQLDRIVEGTEKVNDLLDRRALLQEQRKAVNMEASFQRQRLQARLSPQALCISHMLCNARMYTCAHSQPKSKTAEKPECCSIALQTGRFKQGFLTGQNRLGLHGFPGD